VSITYSATGITDGSTVTLDFGTQIGASDVGQLEMDWTIEGAAPDATLCNAHNVAYVEIIVDGYKYTADCNNPPYLITLYPGTYGSATIELVEASGTSATTAGSITSFDITAGTPTIPPTFDFAANSFTNGT